MKKKAWEDYYNSIKDQIPDDAELTINIYYGDEEGKFENSTKLSPESEYTIWSRKGNKNIQEKEEVYLKRPTTGPYPAEFWISDRIKVIKEYIVRCAEEDNRPHPMHVSELLELKDMLDRTNERLKDSLT